jgi:hypothetical protein
MAKKPATKRQKRTRFGDYAFETCRRIGHAWFDVASDWTPAPGGVPFTLSCERCDTERRETRSPNGVRIGRPRYVKPKSYALPERVLRDEWWQEYMKTRRR